jgi:hypothetical protein
MCCDVPGSDIPAFEADDPAPIDLFAFASVRLEPLGLGSYR